MSWGAAGGGGEWNSGPATHDNFTSQDTRSGFDNFGDANAANGYGGASGHDDTNSYGDTGAGHGGGNDGACFNCGENG